MLPRVSAIHHQLAIIAAAALATMTAHAQNREILGEYRIGVVGGNQSDAVYYAAQRGAQDAARALSEQHSIDVEVLSVTPNLEQGDSQTAALAELIIENADGFLISPDNPESIRPAIEFAQQQGQQVVFFEHQMENVHPLATMVADEVKAGRLAAQAILNTLPTKGRVAILINHAPDSRMRDRLEGARTVLGHRRIQKIVHCAPNYPAAIATIRATEIADRNHLIKGWLFLGDWPLLGMPALPWKAGALACVAIQSSPSAFMYMDQGYVSALVVHPYYNWGYSSATALINKLHKDIEPKVPTTISAPRLIDRHNIDTYRKDCKIWLR
jgi:ribose transport system substrate-binding protein